MRDISSRKAKKGETFDYRSSVATVEQLGKLKLSVERVTAEG